MHRTRLTKLAVGPNHYHRGIVIMIIITLRWQHSSKRVETMHRLPLARDGLRKLPASAAAAPTATQALVDRGVQQLVPATSGGSAQCEALQLPRVRSPAGAAEWLKRVAQQAIGESVAGAATETASQVEPSAACLEVSVGQASLKAQRTEAKPVLKDHGRRHDLPSGRTPRGSHCRCLQRLRRWHGRNRHAYAVWTVSGEVAPGAAR